MSSVLVDQRLAPEALSLLTLLGRLGGCAPVGGLARALGLDRKAASLLLLELAAAQLVRTRPMLGEELVQMVSPAWELVGLSPKLTTRLTYKRIRTGDLSLQYYAEFGRHLSAEVVAGLPQEQKYKEITAKLADLGREIRRKRDLLDRVSRQAAEALQEPERVKAEGRRAGAERELKRLRQQRTELQREHEPFLASCRAALRLDSLGVYRDLESGAVQSWVALDLGYLPKSLPETLQRCDAVAASAGAPWRLLVWGVERAERAAVEGLLTELLGALPLRNPPQEARVLPYARVVR